MPLLYLDTNVIMDHILDRDFTSTALLRSALECHHDLLISAHTMQELEHQGLRDGSQWLVEIFRGFGKLHYCAETPPDLAHAQDIVRTHQTHFADALHKTIAKRHGADILVTKNIKDFRCFTDIPIMRPDET